MRRLLISGILLGGALLPAASAATVVRIAPARRVVVVAPAPRRVWAPARRVYVPARGGYVFVAGYWR